MSDLRKSMKDITSEDVLNGIAYNPKNQNYFVTENWSKLFEIMSSNKSEKK